MKFTPQITAGESSSPKKGERLHTVTPAMAKSAAHQDDPAHRFHTLLGRDTRPHVSQSGALQRIRGRRSRAY